MLFVVDKFKYDDYREIKKEHQTNTECLKRELDTVTYKLKSIDEQSKLRDKSMIDIFHGFPDLDLADKKHIINMIPPTNIDYKMGNVSLKLNNTLSKIIVPKQ